MFEKENISPGIRALRAAGFFLACGFGLWLIPFWVKAALAIGLVIMVHEFGHFLVCKLTGIRVEIFSLGFGAPLLSFDHGGTRYQVGAIPVGGFVKPAGEFDDKAAEPLVHAPDEFLGKPWYVRGLVALAGPVFNFVFPVLFLFALYATVGVPFFLAPPQIVDVSSGSAAAEAGLEKDDQILKIDGEWTFDANSLKQQVDAAARRHPGVETKLSVLRKGRQVEIKALSRLDHDAGRYRLGVQVDDGPAPLRKRVDKVDASTPAEKAGFLAGDEILGVGGKLLKQGNDFNEQFATAQADPEGMVSVEIARLGKTMVLAAPKVQPLPQGIDPKLVGLLGLNLERDTDLSGGAEKRYEKVGPWPAAKYSFYVCAYTATAIVSGLADLVRGKLPFRESVGGPVAMMRMAHQAAENGLFELAQLAMRISLMLGIMNLLPIPILDGATVIFCLVEGLRRKPLSVQLQTMLQNVFGALLIAFMLFVVANDLISTLPKH
jgi:regulator of sigma E protease